MEISGKIIAVLNEKSGVSASTGKPWRVIENLLETIEPRPRHVAFEVFGEERIAACHIEVGEELTVSFDMNAREYNGKWYNQFRAWQVQRPNGVASAQPKAVATYVGVPQADTVAPQAVASSQVSASAAISAPQLMTVADSNGNDPLPFDDIDEPPF